MKAAWNRLFDDWHVTEWILNSDLSLSMQLQCGNLILTKNVIKFQA